MRVIPLPPPQPTSNIFPSRRMAGMLEWGHGREEANCSRKTKLGPHGSPKTWLVATCTRCRKVERSKSTSLVETTMLSLKKSTTSRCGSRWEEIYPSRRTSHRLQYRESIRFQAKSPAIVYLRLGRSRLNQRTRRGI